MAINRRVIYRKAGGPRVIDLIEEEVPCLAPHEVMVRIEAAGVSFADMVQRLGCYAGQPKFPMTPGYDICGRIVEVGRDAGRRLRKGQRVAGMTVFGGQADYICLDPELLVPVSDDVDVAQVVALCSNYVAASQMMHRCAGVEPGETMLVHAAGGGIGSALLELGALYEMKIYGTVSKSKARIVEELGAVPIDYKSKDFLGEVQRLTDGKGVMAAFDAIGARNALKSVKCLSENGRLVTYGTTAAFASGRRHRFHQAADHFFSKSALPPLFNKAQSILSYNIETLRAARPGWYREDLTLLVDLLETNRLKPVIAARYPLEKAAEAHAAFANARAPGKIVLICEDMPPRPQLAIAAE
jgi:NADPH2:quinone reductase